MTKRTKIQKLKLFIKASIIIGVLFVFVVCGILLHPVHTFENASMKKWLSLDETQRASTIERVIKDSVDTELMIKCVSKIATLENSNEMAVKDAIVICDAGIKANSDNEKIDDKESK